MTAQWDDQIRSLGAFIRAQRKLANLSLRKAAELAEISNPYLSQLERGLHEPSVRVLQSIARALDISAETLLEQAGVIDPNDHGGDAPSTEAAIRADPRLTDDQKLALLSVYRSYVAVAGNGASRAPAPPGGGGGAGPASTAGA